MTEEVVLKQCLNLNPEKVLLWQQQIEVKEYGRKLNPLAMFYMMIAVIVPSLGMTMLVVLATFVGLKLSLLVLVLLLLLFQRHFLSPNGSFWVQVGPIVMKIGQSEFKGVQRGPN